MAQHVRFVAANTFSPNKHATGTGIIVVVVVVVMLLLYTKHIHTHTRTEYTYNMCKTPGVVRTVLRSCVRRTCR